MVLVCFVSQEFLFCLVVFCWQLVCSCWVVLLFCLYFEEQLYGYQCVVHNLVIIQFYWKSLLLQLLVLTLYLVIIQF